MKVHNPSMCSYFKIFIFGCEGFLKCYRYSFERENHPFHNGYYIFHYLGFMVENKALLNTNELLG